MRVEETSFLNEYIAMADYGDRLGWHERNGGNFTYWMKPENVADVKDELHDKGNGCRLVPMWTTLQMNIF